MPPGGPVAGSKIGMVLASLRGRGKNEAPLGAGKRLSGRGKIDQNCNGKYRVVPLTRVWNRGRGYPKSRGEIPKPGKEKESRRKIQKMKKNLKTKFLRKSIAYVIGYL